MQALTDLRNAETRLVEQMNSVADSLEAIGTDAVENALMRVENAAREALARLEAITSRMQARVEAMTAAVNALADGMTTPATTTTTCTSSTTSGPTTTSTATTPATTSSGSTPTTPSTASSTPASDHNPARSHTTPVEALEPGRRPDPLEDTHDARHARNGRATSTLPPPARTARRKRR